VQFRHSVVSGADQHRFHGLGIGALPVGQQLLEQLGLAREEPIKPATGDLQASRAAVSQACRPSGGLILADARGPPAGLFFFLLATGRNSLVYEELHDTPIGWQANIGALRDWANVAS
jgi:hypothetical protein